MLASKERSQLRGLANKMDAILQVGKDGITPELTVAVDEALEARELIKLSVLNNCSEEPKSVGETLSGRTRSELVQVMGKKIVLYRKNKKKTIIKLD